MPKTCLALLLGLLAGIAACSRETPAERAQQPSPKPPAVLDPQLQALDKARDVQKQVDEGARAQREAIDRAGG